MLKKIIFVILISYPVKIFSQDNEVIKYIRSISCTKIEEKEFSTRSDSIYISLQKNDEISEISFYNNTNFSIYLFSSYLKDEFVTNPYFSRIDRKAKTIKISFLPILPGTILSDRIILGESKVLLYHQILYEFIEIKPHCYYKMSINSKAIEDSMKKRTFFVEDFNVNSFKQRDKIRKIKKSKIKGDYRIVFEFAYYNHLDFIYKRDYEKAENLIEDSKAFKIIDLYWKPAGVEIMSGQ